MGELVRQHFSDVTFQGVPVRITSTPLRDKPKVFSVPALRFGQDKILRVGRNQAAGEVPLSDLGKARMGHLLDPEGGLAVTSTLDTQYLLAPEQLDRDIVRDFQERLQKTVRQFAHVPYRMELVLYRDRDANTLKQQVDAITSALQQAGVSGGHGVFILPHQARPDLHNYLKRTLHDHIQFQCVSALKVQAFYRLAPRDGCPHYAASHELEQNYVSYLRYTAMGLLLVNRQWPWVLEHGTHYDVYIGVDVLHNTAAFTFFYEGGRRCFVRSERSKQKEKLLRKQICAIVYTHLREDLAGLQRQPCSLVLRRDGQVYESEWLGFKDAIKRLINEGWLPEDVCIGVVEVPKQSALGFRIGSDPGNGRLRNPKVGAWCEAGRNGGIVCTTGYPFTFSGTVRPLSVKIARGNLDLIKALQDTFAMSQLC